MHFCRPKCVIEFISKIYIKLRAPIDNLLIRQCTCTCSSWLLEGGGGDFKHIYFCLGLLAINRRKGVMVWPSTDQDMLKIVRCSENWLVTTLDTPSCRQWRLLAGNYNMGSVCKWANGTARKSEDSYVQADNIINFPCMAYPADTNNNRNDRYIFGQMSKTINIFWH